MALQLGSGDLFWMQPNFTIGATSGFKIAIAGGTTLTATDITLATGSNLLASAVAADIQAKVRAAGPATFVCEFVNGKFRMYQPDATAITITSKSTGTTLANELLGGFTNASKDAKFWFCRAPQSITGYTQFASKLAMLDSATLEVTADFKTAKGDTKFNIAGVAVSADAKFRANIVELDPEVLQYLYGWKRTGSNTNPDPFIYILDQDVAPVEQRFVYKVPYDVTSSLTMDTTLIRAVAPNAMMAFKKEDYYGQEIEFTLLADVATGQVIKTTKNV